MKITKSSLFSVGHGIIRKSRVWVIRFVVLLLLVLISCVVFILYQTEPSSQSIDCDDDQEKSPNLTTFGIIHDSTINSVHNFKRDLKFNDQPFNRYYKYKKLNFSRVWPIMDDKEDRIIDQLNIFVKKDESVPPKIIFMRWGYHDMPPGREQFLKDDCPVNWCNLTDRYEDAVEADMIFYRNVIRGLDFWCDAKNRNPNQVTLLFIIESPLNSQHSKKSVNWTATYRTDSVLSSPYKKFAYFKRYKKVPIGKPTNYAENKNKMIVWLVSNCYAPNGRFDYVKHLSKFIDVDIFGDCGVKALEGKEVKKIIRDYKFYLSFENSHCQDYITEKFFDNALGNDILPIVMGARLKDYEKLAPPKSYIHVDEFESPKDLAEYLHKLDQDDELYNSYFAWKDKGELIDSKFWCRLCALLHERDRSGLRMWYDDFQEWWNGTEPCLNSIRSSQFPWFSWNNQ